MTLIQLLQSGASMRYRDPYGFYTVLSGKSTPLSDATGRAAVQSGLVRPAGKDQHGVYLFTLSQKAANAVPAMHCDSKALPRRPAAVPDALPDVPSVRCKANPKTAAAVPAHGGAAQGQVPRGIAAVGCAGAQRAGAEGAGKGDGVGCGSCKGVTA